jgi:hypothetical protein
MNALCEAQADIAAMNADCFCLPRAAEAARAKVASRMGDAGFAALLAERPHLFAETSVFLAPETRAEISAQIAAIEEVFAAPAYEAAILARNADPALRAQPGTRGVLMGYDFHIAHEGPRLIEINTNAGGAFLMAALRGDPAEEAALADMFGEEWARSGRAGGPATVAIVDEAPEGQYLYPDMLLARGILSRAGIDAFIADPGELRFEAGRLRARGRAVDLVYNRLTDFALSEPAHKALREALLADAAIVTPAPRHHALYADKRNLALLASGGALAALGLSDGARRNLEAIPRAIPVTGEGADALWASRRDYFFKPECGFGSRGAYRGDKLTKSVWSRIVEGGYIAQAFVPPASRAVRAGGAETRLKYDLRAYAYAGRVLFRAARLYQGQATNFRTAGGGLAEVIDLAPGARCDWRQP